MGNASNFPKSKHCPEHIQTFSGLIEYYRKEKGLSGAELARRSCLSQPTVSRILRNCNDKGAAYRPDENVVFLLSVGLGLDPRQYEELLRLAFPERAIWCKALEEHWSVDDLFIELYEKGLPLPVTLKEE